MSMRGVALLLLIACGCGGAKPQPVASKASGAPVASARTASSARAAASVDPEWARELAGKGADKQSQEPAIVDSSPAPVPDGYRRVEQPGWSLAVPSAFVDRKTKPPVVFGASAPGKEDIVLSVNLVLGEFDGDSESYARANLPAIASEATVMNATPVTLPGGHVVIVESLWPNGIAPYRTLQLIAAAKGKGYVLTCAEADMRFEAARPTCVTILKSFRFAR